MRLLGNKPLSAVVGTVVALALAGVVWLAVGSGGRDDGTDDPGAAGSDAADATPRKARRKRREANAAAEPPQFQTLACKVYTHEPGFFVLVDGELARDQVGKKLTTPCQIGLTKGNHTLTVVREKFRDFVEQITIAKEQTFEFTPTYEPFADRSGFFASHMSRAKLGEPIELVQVNVGGPGWDPFVSADGLTLWLAGQKSDGKGIYVSRRANLYDDFGPPELVVKTSERPASPSVTSDGLIVAYTLPIKAQVRSLIRTSSDAPFKSGPVLRQSDKDDDRWPAAQISPDGKALYYTEARGGKNSVHVTKRKSLRKPFDGEARVVRIPGGHPRLMEDGLRQFWFDGARLFRASRGDQESAFSEPETVSEPGFDGYTSRDEYRQYFVSDDEQWLFYSDDPQAAGKLYAVRIADGPRWGYAPVGKPIALRETARTARASAKPEGDAEKPAAAEPEPEPEPPRPDPRKAPLPYAEFRDRLDKLVGLGDYPAARDLVTAALGDPNLAASKTPLAWDLEDVQRLIQFRKRIDEAFANLKTGDLIKAGTIQVEFEKYEDGIVSGKAKGTGKPVTRSLSELAPLDVLGVVDKRVDRNEQAAQIEIATFLSRSPQVSPQQLQLRFDRAGAVGKELAERRHLRRLHLIELEIARDNLGPALQQLEQLISSAPKSQAATQARDVRESLYSRMNWRKVGKQTWNSPAPGEFATAGGKSPGSLLASPGEYRNFVMTLEWKTTVDTAQGGVYFRYTGRGNLRKNAFKIHVVGDYALRNTPDPFSTGSLLGIKPPRSNAVKPNGEWNTMALRAEGDRIGVTINGVEVLDTRATSKDVPERGLVCLDGEFSGITYRKVLVYELPE